MVDNIYVAIMAGGAGTRFWPASKKSAPKQFLDVLGRGKTLIRETFDRFAEFVEEDRIKVVSGSEYSPLIRNQLSVPQKSIIEEPMMRNTSAAVALTAFQIQSEHPDAIIVMTPADHLIGDENKYRETILKCVDFAGKREALLTIGIEPTSPHTGYGYIEKGAEENGMFRVVGFKEKPNLERATEFLSTGNYFWNAGIFVWSVGSILSAFEQYAPEIYNPLAQLFADGKPDVTQLERVYSQLPSISVDYSILEKAQNVYTCPSQFGWSDLGSWKTVYEHSEKDNNRNVVSGSLFTELDSKGNLVRGEKDKLYALMGIEDMGIIDTGDVLMVFPLSRDQEVKALLNSVRKDHGKKFD